MFPKDDGLTLYSIPDPIYGNQVDCIAHLSRKKSNLSRPQNTKKKTHYNIANNARLPNYNVSQIPLNCNAVIKHSQTKLIFSYYT